jgi:hypothetical protein
MERVHFVLLVQLIGQSPGEDFPSRVNPCMGMALGWKTSKSTMQLCQTSQSGEDYSRIELALPPSSQLERQSMTSTPIFQSMPAEPAIQSG